MVRERNIVRFSLKKKKNPMYHLVSTEIKYFVENFELKAHAECGFGINQEEHMQAACDSFKGKEKMTHSSRKGCSDREKSGSRCIS